MTVTDMPIQQVCELAVTNYTDLGKMEREQSIL